MSKHWGSVIGWLAVLLGGVSWGGWTSTAIAQTVASEPPASDVLESPAEDRPFLRPRTACPQDLELLFQGLLRDLPSYANRVARRSLGIQEEPLGFGTVLLAGRAEFEPLDIAPRTFATDGNSEPMPEEDVHQVFFTTLERHYTQTTTVNLEQYHWLFLTQAADGWRLVLMFTRTAPDEGSVRPPTPPRENSDGIVGQAVQLWLRDCRAGAIYPIEATEDTDEAVTD